MILDDNFFRILYNDHLDYQSLRGRSGLEYEKYLNDVKHWKTKYLEDVFFSNLQIENVNSILEIGCATGVLLNTIFAKNTFDRTGIDISEENISSGRETYPNINFIAGTFQEYIDESGGNCFSIIILSDILEHVQEDVELLNLSGKYSDYVLLNQPIEKVKEYENREYGVNDKEGHLRAYSTEDILGLCKMANMSIIYSIERQYVLEPVFKKHLLNKILNEETSKVDGMIKYTNELIDIELNKENYKRNFFALLKSENDRSN